MGSQLETSRTAALRDAKDESRTLSRKLGLNELSYFLPSRANGLNDICIGVEVAVPARSVSNARICLSWSLLRFRNPLCAARVEMPPGQYDDAKFIYSAPHDPVACLGDAINNLSFVTDRTFPEAVKHFATGPRTLSSNKLSHLTVIRSDPHSLSPSSSSAAEREPIGFLFLASHCITDAAGIHMALNELFALLGGPLSESELSQMLISEWSSRRGHRRLPRTVMLGTPSECSLGIPNHRLKSVAHTIDHQLVKSRDIGGQVFPRLRPEKANNEVWERTFDPATSKRILKRCKEHGVTASNALFAVCNFAWIRTQRAIRAREGRSDDRQGEKLPMLMYTAVNMRGVEAKLSSDGLPGHIALSLGYLNIILPSFIPRGHQDPSRSNSSGTRAHAASEEAIFWHRARDVRRQHDAYIRHPLIAKRTVIMYQERAARAMRFALEDDAADPRLRNAAWTHGRPISSDTPSNTKPPVPASSVSQLLAERGFGPSPLPAPPTAALMGLSLIGNIDNIYNHSSHGALTVERMLSTNRTGRGNSLLAARTLRGSFTIHLVLDVAAFERTVLDEFWENFGQCVKEYLVGDVAMLEARAHL